MPHFVWWILGALLASGVIFWIVSYIVAARQVYKNTLRRNSKEQWSREIPSDLAPDSLEMYAKGQAWADANKDFCTDVHITHDGLNLYGEFYNFGGTRCAMILSGRTECLKYGYYFAIPYATAGFNILVVDPRGHGKSDGEFNTVGFEESKDAIAWVRHIHDAFGQRSFVFHGICIGAAGGILALTAEDCPDYVDAIVTEGMFPNFGESMKNHLIERKKPVRGLYWLINRQMRLHTGHSMSVGPIDFIDKLKKPLLMLHSKEDLYSTPFYAQKLFDMAGTADKTLVWFDHGRHSMLRITDTLRYDGAITDFLAKTFATKQI